jgi:hypothetical protein
LSTERSENDDDGDDGDDGDDDDISLDSSFLKVRQGLHKIILFGYMKALKLMPRSVHRQWSITTSNASTTLSTTLSAVSLTTKNKKRKRNGNNNKK